MKNAFPINMSFPYNINTQLINTQTHDNQAKLVIISLKYHTDK